MPGKGREHFDTYTPQNRVKHAILVNYLGAYLQALGRVVDAFHYVDGFAGAGTYDAVHAGSPLYAIELLARYPDRGMVSFIENDPALFDRLENAVADTPGVNKLKEFPWLRCAEFSECLDEVLQRSIPSGPQRVATFAFIDPCGLKGLYLDDLAKILRLRYAECLVFLNYDGLTRWLGAVQAGTHPRAKLDRFFGSASAAAGALACREAKTVSREACLLGVYVEALRKHSGARFVLPFRFRAIERNRTSHYLVHLAQHELAFKIMKEIMNKESSEVDDYGAFESIPDGELPGQAALFRPNAERARVEILNELRIGARPVRLFLNEWPLRPTDMLVAKEYRKLLLDLEAEQCIDVIDPKAGAVLPAERRPKRSGQATLSERYYVRIRR
jgi:three-Cys-motif partner protein